MACQMRCSHKSIYLEVGEEEVDTRDDIYEARTFADEEAEE